MKGFFDLKTAEKLLSTYKNQPAKADFLKELIYWQYFFGETPIVGTKISLNRRYQRQTVITVLTQLGYSNISVHNVKQYNYTNNAFTDRITEVTFS